MANDNDFPYPILPVETGKEDSFNRFKREVDALMLRKYGVTSDDVEYDYYTAFKAGDSIADTVRDAVAYEGGLMGSDEFESVSRILKGEDPQKIIESE